MRDEKFIVWIVAGLIFALSAWANVLGAEQSQRNVILSTTTSTQDSGLLDVLVPLFEKQSGYTVKTVAVGTGQALALAAKGEAKAFADFMVAPQTQAVIAKFGVDKFGQPLFVPVAGMREEEIGR